MTTVKFKWLNDGEETKLAAMPLKGQRDLLALQKNRAKYQAAVTKYRFILLCETALAAKKTMDRFGVEKAHEAWNATIDANFAGHRGLKFDLESFDRDLESWLNDFVYKRLDAKDLDESRIKLDEATEILKEEMKNIDSEKIAETNHELYLLTAYWRLRATGIEEVLTPEGPKKIDWALDKQSEAIEIIAEVLTDDDILQLYGGGKEKDVDDLDMEDLAPMNAADVQGKSRKPIESMTESPVNSDAS